MLPADWSERLWAGVAYYIRREIWCYVPCEVTHAYQVVMLSHLYRIISHFKGALPVMALLDHLQKHGTFAKFGLLSLRTPSGTSMEVEKIRSDLKMVITVAKTVSNRA